MSNFNNLSTVNKSSSFKTLTAKINNHTIEADNIIDMLIKWGPASVFGHLTINDMYDLTNYALNANDTITVSLTDAYDNLMVRDFTVISTSEKKAQSQKTIQIDFRDSISLALSRIYLDKSYSSTTLDKILLDYLKLGPENEITKYKIEKIIKNTPYVMKNFCIPKNVSFLSFFETECDKQGVFFYQDKKSIILTPPEINVSPVMHEFPYKEMTSNDLYGFKIMEYKLLFNNTAETELFPKTNAYIYDPSTKTMQLNEYRIDDFKDVMNKGGVVKANQFTQGELYTTGEYILNNSRYKSRVFRKNTVLEIIVPGNVEYSKLFRDMKIEMVGNINSTVTKNDGDIKLSGVYECFEIQDRIIGSKFFQKLSLYRINEGKK